MKKTVILILAVLPIFLLVTIAFAGRILALYHHIAVERVEFVDQYNTPWSSEDYLVLEANTTKETKIKIYPELASNKEVTYSVLDEAVCTIDEKGVITGIAFGTTEVYVETVDSGKTATLKVRVTEDNATGIELDKTELELNIGDSSKLTATVLGSHAVKRAVTWASSNPDLVKVDKSGKVTARAAGEAIITATTKDGGHTAECKVTVLDGIPALAFDFSSVTTITEAGELLYTSLAEIRLLDYLVIDETKVNPEDVQIYIQSGGNHATLSEDGVLTIAKQSKIITITAYVDDKNTPTVLTSVKFVYKT